MAIGMAACDHQDASRPPDQLGESLPQLTLIQRLEEEIDRALRHGTPLSCLLLHLDAQQEMERTHGQLLMSELHSYTSATLARQFRRFDRLGRLDDGGLLALLPGADASAAELVARRVLSRVRAIKVEIRGARQSVRVCASVAQWRSGQTAQELISEVCAVAAHERLGFRDALGV